MNRSFTRRTILCGAAAQAAGLLVPLCDAAEAPAAKTRPLSTVRVAIVGVGSRGMWLLRLLAGLEGVELKAGGVSAEELFGRVADRHGRDVREQGLTLETEVAADTPPIRGDAARLEQGAHGGGEAVEIVPLPAKQDEDPFST